MNGIMRFHDHLIEVVNVIPQSQNGRNGWLASDAFMTGIGISPRETQMFYPNDMFTFEETPADHPVGKPVVSRKALERTELLSRVSEAIEVANHWARTNEDAREIADTLANARDALRESREAVQAEVIEWYENHEQGSWLLSPNGRKATRERFGLEPAHDPQT